VGAVAKRGRLGLLVWLAGQRLRRYSANTPLQKIGQEALKKSTSEPNQQYG
jgi:hypothetical protein